MTLEKLQHELQQIAEAIMSVTSLDVTIMDNNLKRIAGTGNYRKLIGNYAPRNSVFEKSISTGKQYVIVEPRTGSECRDCFGKHTCTEEAEVCYPIQSDQGVEGIIGMIAFSPEQKRAFLKNQQNFMNFVSRMSKLISSRNREQILHEELQNKSIELRAIIDSVDEGIIAIDENNKILCINEWAKKILGLENMDVIGKNLDKLLPENSVTKVLKTNKQIKEQEEVLDINDAKFRFLLSAKPILFSHEKTGAVATFKDFNKLHKSILKISEGTETFTFDRLLGRSPIFLRAKEQARQIAHEDVTVLISGDSGTGKELFARAIHNESPRAADIFVPVNCGAIPDTLMESELFGYEKGSFTGANPQGKIGKFEMAHGGTIFLDEIGDMPLHMQVKLLRVIQERELVRIGGLKPIKIDVRIIAATHRNLWDLVQKEEFREDLYYRLNVVPIHIPPLRERYDDIVELAEVFLVRYAKIYNKNILGISDEAKSFLLSLKFPGNVRELENLIEYGVIFEQDNVLNLDTLAKKVGNSDDSPEEKKGLKEMVMNYEKRILKDMLKHYGHDTKAKQKIADHLKISTATLYRKLREAKL